MKITKLIPPCVLLAGLGLAAALLLGEHEDAPSVRSTSQRVSSSERESKPSRERMVALASERSPELEDDEPLVADELEILQSATREEAAETRRLETARAEAKRRVLYAQNLSNLEMAAAEAEVAGDAARAEALRKRMALLSERAREEGHGDG